MGTSQGLVLDDYRKYWVGFNLVKGIGAVRLRSLLDVFGDAKAAWDAPQDALKSAGLHPNLVANLAKARKEISLEKVWENIQKLGITVLTWEDPAYPSRLKDVSPSAPVLYLRGTLEPDDTWAVAIVGTRRVSAYGRQVTARIATRLAQAGVTIVSGLARGVDGIAHKTALEQGGRTLAVLGSGVDRIYPPEHRNLATQIMEQGAVISNYPPGTAPEASNFPPRNRIISGLSMATIIVEAGARSGALITAAFAVEQGRDVFAVPGSILAPQSQGTNRLIQEGARVLLDPQDILEVLDLTRVTEQSTARMVLPTNATEAQLFEVLSHEPLHVDEIRNQTRLSIEDVTANLALMELKGMVRQVGGMRYTAIREDGIVYSVDEGLESE
jgi:DNA processing protein